jgi:hypothetical protein
MLRDDFGRLPLCPLGRGACYSTLLELTVFTRFRYAVGEHCASGEGEAGFLLRPDSAAAKLVTALHNLMDEIDELGYNHMCQGHSVETACAVTIPNTGWKKQDAVTYRLRNGVCWSACVDISLGPSISESKALVHWSNNPNQKVIPFHSYGGAHLRPWALLHHSGRVALPIRKIKKAFCAFGMIHPYPASSDKTCNKT